MLAGKVTVAIKLLDSSQGNLICDKSQPSGILKMNNDALSELKEKHPAENPQNHTVMIDGEIPFIDPVIFHTINEDQYKKLRFQQRVLLVHLVLMQIVGDEL